MPKTPSSKLFHLVKSLSGSEKRYFKLSVHNKDAGNNKYTKLFEAIEAQDEFDDDALRHVVYGDTPIETRKYSELKSYLYDLVLKSLQAYDEKSSVGYRLKNMLMGVRTLFKRSHFEDCKDLLKKAGKFAVEYEDFSSLVEILNWEKRIAYTQTDIAFLDKELDRITLKEKNYLKQLSNISAYRNIFFKMLVSIRKDVSRSKKQISELTKLMESPLMKDDTMATSYTARVLFYRISSIYFFSVSDLSSFYNANKKLLKLMEGNRNMMKEDVSEYISALNNHIISCGQLEKYGEVRTALEKLSNIKPITTDDAVKIHRQYYNNKFRLCIATGEFEEGRRELSRHFKELEKLDKQQFLKSNFYFQYFCIYFGCEDYRHALDWLNEWLSLSGGVERKDLQSLARILNLVIHYELGNTMLLESLLRSTYRYLNKQNRLSELEKKFMHFIREATKPHTRKETKEALETLKQDFERLSILPSYNIFDLFDINSWLESKISGKPFAVVVRDKFNDRLSTHPVGTG